MARKYAVTCGHPPGIGHWSIEVAGQTLVVSTDSMEIVGPYRLTGRLGDGGMGAVYRAYDPRLDRVVAIKRLRPGSSERDETARQRLRREARAVARLHHPSIVQVFDIVEDEAEDWVVMELVEGETLARRLAGGPLSVDEALALGVEVAEGLDAAHRAGIVHRDLKSDPASVEPLVNLFHTALDGGRLDLAENSLEQLARLGVNGLAGSLERASRRRGCRPPRRSPAAAFRQLDQ